MQKLEKQQRYGNQKLLVVIPLSFNLSETALAFLIRMVNGLNTQ